MTNIKKDEIKILNNAIKKIEKKKGKKLVQLDENKKIIDIVEKFIIKKKLICYGGTAINNILPNKDQFYDKNIEFPDYDFFSTNALDDAKELADIYFKANYLEVEAKAGIHEGTFKVFVNFKAVADITQLDNSIFKMLKNDSIIKNKIYYAPPNFLRMSMYLELSRPDGDVSRWEKVLKRLILLNKNYPLKGIECDSVDFDKEFKGPHDKQMIFDIIKKVALQEKLVFFGGYSLSLYSKYYKLLKLNNNPDFDLLSNNPKETANKIETELQKKSINSKIIFHEAIGENIPYHYEIKINNNSVAFIYKTQACYNYNNIKINNKIYRIATIDTLLSFYLAFYYTKQSRYDKNRILCISEYIFKIQQKNRLSQKGVLKRFTPFCYGKQNDIAQIRREKNYKYNLLKTRKNSKEFEYNFLKYNPNFNEEMHADKFSYISLKKKKTLSKKDKKSNITTQNKTSKITTKSKTD
jgi:hypothetical protein